MKQYEKQFTCVMCGNTFMSKAHSADRCPTCRKERIKELAKQNYHKNKYGKNKKPCKETIGAIIRKLNEYNRINNTHLSYGQYVSEVMR